MSRNLTEKAWYVIGISLVSIWLVWLWNADRFVPPETRTGDSPLPFYIHSHLKLARSWDPFHRGSLRLICTTAQKVHIVLQAKLPGREYHRVGWEDGAALYIDARTRHNLSFQAAGLVAMGSVDTILTEPLSASQLANLADWMNEAWSKRFWFTAMELGVVMHGFARGDEVRDFTARCTGHS